MNATLPIAVHVFFLRGAGDTELLTIKRKGTGFADGLWSVPAGRLEVGESITSAAVREAFEEVGLQVDRDDLSKPLIMHHKNERGERIYAFFIARRWQGKPKNMETDKCEKIEWKNIAQLGPDFLAHVHHALAKLVAGEAYCEEGF